MMSIRTAIADDEPLAVELLADYVQRTPRLILAEASSDVFTVLKLVQAGAIDLVLLDIQMPELSGIQFLKITGDKCRVILTTAYPEYALQSYDFNVTDYLLKPFSYERFLKAIDKIPAGTPSLQPAERPAHIFVKSEYRLIKVNLSDVLYIEAHRDYIAIHTLHSRKIMSLESLRNMDALLPPGQFSRIHKSYIIAIDKITAVEKGFVTVGGNLLPVGSSFQKTFYEKLGVTKI